jgi:diguanylate cyclase (GGDEF)-like protein
MNPTTTRILLIEDSEDDAFLLRAALERAFPALDLARVDNAADMRAALEREWDVVISDHVMPRFDAFRALNVLKAAGRDIPFIIHSGAIETDSGVSAMRIGADDFVCKGDYGRLVPVVERALRHVRALRARGAAEASASRLANCDPLTGLANRKRFSELVQDAIGATPQAALFYLDIDRFMRINDSFGYASGDLLLRQVAQRLEVCRGEGEIVARIGHDEFALYAPGVDGREAARLRADRVKQCFADAFQLNGQSLFLTVSIGAAIAPEDALDAGALLRNAEAAMFSAKRQGRNGLQTYQRELDGDSGRRLRLETALRHAVERDELFLVYQPIIDVASSTICATEALVRWRHPELGVIPPDQFISIADESGLILEVGDWVLRTAALQAQRWRQDGWKDMSMAVNFSAAQFKQQHFEMRVREALAAAALDPSCLELEITETLAMQNAEATAETLRRLKDLGVRVSIDDFGTGYSSLGYLRRFPIDILKIDRSFVRDADRDADSAAIVRTIVALARALKLKVVAEGVETAEQRDFLAREGVDRMQGYHFAKPCEAKALEALLVERNGPRERLRAAA